jgi:hypothetical protein
MNTVTDLYPWYTIGFTLAQNIDFRNEKHSKAEPEKLAGKNCR